MVTLETEVRERVGEGESGSEGESKSGGESGGEGESE